MGVPIPQSVDEMVEPVKLIPQERIRQCAVEWTVDVPVLQIEEEIAKMVKASPQERIPLACGTRALSAKTEADRRDRQGDSSVASLRTHRGAG